MRYSAAIAALILSTTSVLAADYSSLRGTQMAATTGYTPSVAAADQPNWEGYYIGAFAGYSHSKNLGSGDVRSLVANEFRLTSIEEEFRVSSWPNLKPGPTRSATFGLFGGYNIMSDEVLIGFDLQAGSFKHKMSASDYIGRAVTPSGGYLEAVTLASSVTRSIDSYATMRLRVGQAMGNFLPYIAGGLAVGKGTSISSVTYRHTGTDADPTASPVLPPFDSGLQTLTSGNRNVYALGISGAIGTDFMIGSNFFGRAEFSHTRFNSNNISAEISKLNVGAGVKF